VVHDQAAEMHQHAVEFVDEHGKIFGDGSWRPRFTRRSPNRGLTADCAPGCRVNGSIRYASVFAARKLGIKRSDGLMSHEAPVMMNPTRSLVSRSGTLKEATRS
jgi:hypothetical protein